MKRLVLCLSVLALLAVWAGTWLFPLRPTASVWTVSMPVPGGLSVRVHVPRLIRLATSPWGIWLLDGWTVRTPWGRVRATATDGGRELDLRCSPCAIAAPAIDRSATLRVDVQLRLAREGRRVAGRLTVDRLFVRLTGTLGDDGVSGDFELTEAPVRDLYAPLTPAIPELSSARIQGTIAARGRFRLPEGTLELAPELRGFEVRGLRTDRLARGPFDYPCASASGTTQVCRGGEGTADWVALRDLGRWLPRAVVAAEDARFFDHPGYDRVETIAALQADLDARRVYRGGSTLTQQLARSLFPPPDRTLARTLREILYTVEMEQTLGKQRILALYLNTVKWGPGIHGARQAALAYFGKEPKNLQPEEAAWLAAILRNPWKAWYTQFMKWTPDAERVAWVLGRMKGLNRAEGERARTRCLQFTASNTP